MREALVLYSDRDHYIFKGVFIFSFHSDHYTEMSIVVLLEYPNLQDLGRGRCVARGSAACGISWALFCN